MKFCFCGNQSFARDKKTNTPYCKNHQYLRTDLDKRTISQKGIAKYKERQEIDSESIQELTVDLDRVISRYVRLRYMEADCFITCYICGSKVHWKDAHAMHFIDRDNKITRFMLDNIRGGCYDCNVVKDGNLYLYAQKLNEERAGLAEELKELSYCTVHATRSDLKEMLFDFQQKLKLVETKLNIYNGAD